MPGEPGNPASVVLDPAVPYYTVTGTVMTGAKKSVTSVQMERAPGSKTLRIYGTVAAGGSGDVEEVAIQDPAEYAAIALKTMLEARGVVVHGKARAVHHLPMETRGFLEV